MTAEALGERWLEEGVLRLVGELGRERLRAADDPRVLDAARVDEARLADLPRIERLEVGEGAVDAIDRRSLSRDLLDTGARLHVEVAERGLLAMSSAIVRPRAKRPRARLPPRSHG